MGQKRYVLWKKKENVLLDVISESLCVCSQNGNFPKQALIFTCLHQKFLVTSNFSFVPSVFYYFGQLIAILIKLRIVVCKLFQFGRVQNVSFGKGLNTFGTHLYHTLKSRYLVNILDLHQNTQNESLIFDYDLRQGTYSPTILKNVLSLVLPFFLYLVVFECNTTSDWLNHTV